MKKNLASFILLILFNSLCAHAAPSGFTPPFVADEDVRLLNQGMGHYRSKTDVDMKRAEKYFLQSAKMGNAKAAMMLFSIYEVGWHITKDTQKAYKWLHKSAELGGIWSAHSLGHKYQTGHGVDKNLKKSYQYFKQAALGEMSEAKRDLALCFYSGEGTTKDIEQAVYWMTLAANENVSLAQYRLGMWLKNGNIGQKNRQKAEVWFAKAINLFKVEGGKGNQQAALNYAYMNDYGYGVKENNQVAFDSYRKLAQKNNARAQFWLSLMYLNGDGIKKNVPKGKKWLRRSHQLGSTLAKDMLKRNGWLDQNNSSSLHKVQKITANQLDLLNKFAPSINLVLIPAGSFKMGDLSGVYKRTEAPVHSVKIKSFKLMAYEVTFDQYDMFVKDTGHRKPSDYGWGRGRLPVINVSWNDASAYSRWLSKKTGLSFRLPTEAEWEYAARGGSSTRYYFGNNESDLCQYENHADAGTEYSWKNASCDDGVGAMTAFVGQYRPNPYGLYDMLGNLSEWTQDCSNRNYGGAPQDGSAWEKGNCKNRVIRGNLWNAGPKSLRVSKRTTQYLSTTVGHSIGFRLAMETNKND